jgi:pyridoxamine 5'-phosphate oxidase
MALATVDAQGLPDVRMVLLKGRDARGFVFYTNSESAKGQEIAGNSQAAIVLYWKSLNRQVRCRGPVVEVAKDEADAYFASRHRDSRIGAWASRQSRPLDSRQMLEERVAAYDKEFETGDVPRPPYWKGYRIVPSAIEFWQDQPSRLHDRIVFTRAAPGEAWTRQRLFP